MPCELSLRTVAILLLLGALLGSAPGAMVANMLAAALRKKLGLRPMDVQHANQMADDSVDQDDNGGGGDGQGGG